MRSTVVSWALVGLSLIALIGVAAANSQDLIALCNKEKVDLRAVSQLVDLVNTLNKATRVKCPEKVQMALRDLGRIVGNKLATNCTMEKAEAISKFVDDHLKVSADSQETQPDDQLPESLVKFAIAYGMQVSKVCKNYMLNDFMVVTERELSRDRFYYDFWSFVGYMTHETSIAHFLRPILDAGELILPSDLLQIVPEMEIKMGRFVSDSETLGSLKALCANTFQPLYEPVLLPLARLAQAGFNHNDVSSSGEKKKLAEFWSIVAFLCEAVKTMEVEKLPETVFDGASSPQARYVQTKFARFDLNRIANCDSSEPLKRLPAPRVKLQDEILDEKDRPLKKLIKSFNANKAANERLLDRIHQHSRSVFYRMFKKGNNRDVLRRIARAFKSDSDKDSKQLLDALVKLADAEPGSSKVYHTAMIPKYGYRTGKFIVSKATIITAICLLSLLTFDYNASNDRIAYLHDKLYS